MSLQIIYGRAGSGKTTACFEIIDELLKKGNNDCMYIVPSQYSMETERRVAQAFGVNAGRVEVTSFERLAFNVFSKVGPALLKGIDKSGKQMMMEKVLLSLQEELRIYEKSAKFPDFAVTMLNTVNELKRNNVTVDMLLELAEKVTSKQLQYKLLDIAKITEEYNKMFKKPFTDSEDYMNMLCERIEKFGLFKDVHIVVDNFTSYTTGQTAVMELLMKNAVSVTVTCVADISREDVEEYIFKRSVINATRLNDIAISNKIEVKKPLYLKECLKYRENPEFLHMESNFFKYPPETYNEKTENIIISEEENYYKEVDKTAREIINLCRTKNCRFRDITVLTGAEKTYAPVIKTVFDLYDIPFHLDEKISALNNSFISGVLSLFEMGIKKFSFESVFKWLKLNIFNLDEDKLFLLENYVTAVGNTRKMWQSNETLTYRGSEENPYFTDAEMVIINETKSITMRPVLSFYEKIKGRRTFAQLVYAIEEFLSEATADKYIFDSVSKLEKSGNMQQASELVLVYNHFTEILNQILVIFENAPVSLEKFYAVLRAGLSGCEIGQIPSSTDNVMIMSVDKYKNNNQKYVFVLGVNEGVFPTSNATEDLITSREINEIAQHNVTIPDKFEMMFEDENYLVYTTLTSPLERLYLSYSKSDSDGKGIMPSEIINRIKTVFPKITILSDSYQNEKVKTEGENATFIKLLENFDSSDFWREVERWFEINSPDKYEILKSSKAYKNDPRKLRAEIVKLLYSENPQYSVSKVESFAACPFSYFLKYGIKAQPRREYKLNSADLGTYLHNITEAFSKYIVTKNYNDIESDEIEKIAEKMAGEYLEVALSDFYTDSKRQLYMLEKLKKILKTTAVQIVAYWKSAGFEPYGFEVDFSDEGRFPPIKIELENGNTVTLTGKVDRVDILRKNNKNYISIVDYKSADKSLDYSKIAVGLQLQMPVYLKAICDALENEEKVQTIPASVFYYHLDSSVVKSARGEDIEKIEKEIFKELKMKGVWIDDETVSDYICTPFLNAKGEIKTQELDKICSVCYEKLNAAITEILDGKIEISPYCLKNETPCGYCDYKSICFYEEDKISEKYRKIETIKREEFFNL